MHTALNVQVPRSITWTISSELYIIFLFLVSFLVFFCFCFSAVDKADYLPAFQHIVNILYRMILYCMIVIGLRTETVQVTPLRRTLASSP